MAARTSRLHAAAAAALLLLPRAALAADDLVINGSPTLDPPTITALGVQLLVSGDDDHDAKVTVRYRKAGTSTWQDGLPLHRVRPDVVTGFTVPDQFAGSIFDLAPATAYDIELHAVDADGSVDQTLSLQGTTRPVPPVDPKAPNMKPVTDAPSLASALASAQPGDVILLKKGTYAGTFSIHASGTADDPIVIRGESEEEVILDGGGDGGNVLEVYGAHRLQGDVAAAGRHPLSRVARGGQGARAAQRQRWIHREGAGSGRAGDRLCAAGLRCPPRGHG